MGLFGPSQGDRDMKAANKALKQIGGVDQGVHNNLPNVINQLWVAARGGQTAADQAGYNAAQANTLRAYQHAGKQLNMQMNPAMRNSSFAGNRLLQHWNGYGNAMANLNNQQLLAAQQRRDQALNQIGGYAQNAGQSAQGAFQNVFNNGQQMNAQQMAELAGIGNLASQFFPGGNFAPAGKAVMNLFR